MNKGWMFHVWKTQLQGLHYGIFQHVFSATLLSTTRVLQFPQVKQERKMKLFLVTTILTKTNIMLTFQ